MGGYIKGTLVQCMLIGVCCGIGFAVMGIPSAAALGVITGLLNIIPVVGPWLGGGMAAIVGVFSSPLIAVIALVYTIAVQQFIYTFISPKIMGNSVDIHPALVIMALMVGSALGFAVGGVVGNIVGMLASIPAVAAIKSLFVYYFEKRTGRVIVSPDGVIFKGEPSGEEANPVADATGEFSATQVYFAWGKARKMIESAFGKLLNDEDSRRGTISYELYDHRRNPREVPRLLRGEGLQAHAVLLARPPITPSLLLDQRRHGAVQALLPSPEGARQPAYIGATTAQKCVRTNDIDNIGDARHLSFFEMLGNFSFGKYFKNEMCAWAYEFSTEVLGLPAEKLYFTVFENDDETIEIWKSLGVPEDHISKLGEEDNFWRAGPTGPAVPALKSISIRVPT